MGSPPDILTMSTLSLLSLLTTVTISVAQSPSDDCWYGSVGPYNRDSPNQFPIDPLQDTMLLKMTWCQDKCFNDADCQHFTIHTARGGSTCYLLTSCMDPSDSDACIKDGLCNSGPRDCASNNNCDMLPDYVDPASANKIKWQCDGSINPYTQQVPEGETCFLSCNAWVDDTDGKPAVVTSTCEEGTIDYDPNTLPGTDFICTENPIDETNPEDKKFNLMPTNVCRLFCDSYHITTMACENGMWTGEPELGAWCYYEPVETDDMNYVPSAF